MKAIIINNAIPGTAEAFKRVRERRPDILLIAAEAHEDPLVIQQAADLAISADFISRGYTIPWADKQLGADTFVHISFPRHMSYESLGLRRQIFEEACKDLGIRFVFVTAPDPTSDVGVAGAQQYILNRPRSGYRPMVRIRYSSAPMTLIPNPCSANCSSTAACL
jgi:hypothetical protein